EFKRDVVMVARRGDLSVHEVATDFGVAEETVRRWMKQADVVVVRPRLVLGGVTPTDGRVAQLIEVYSGGRTGTHFFAGFTGWNRAGKPRQEVRNWTRTADRPGKTLVRIAKVALPEVVLPVEGPQNQRSRPGTSP
ncbi:MAG: hypothetical protein RLZ55_128, partial [Actinomycetota bacterium]